MRLGLTELEGLRFPAQAAQFIFDGKARRAAEEEWARVAAQGATVLSFGCSDYPERLREIYDPPPVLWVRGDVSLLSQAVDCSGGDEQYVTVLFPYLVPVRCCEARGHRRERVFWINFAFGPAEMRCRRTRRAPRSAARRNVGSVSRMRVSSPTFPLDVGTLKSTRMKTRWPFSCKSRMESLFIALEIHLSKRSRWTTRLYASASPATPPSADYALALEKSSNRYFARNLIRSRQREE